YTVKNPYAAIEKMIEYSGKRIVIIRDTRVMKTLSGIIRESLCSESSRDLNPLIEDLLKEKNMSYSKINISEKREYLIADPEIEAKSLLYQLKLEKNYLPQVLNIINKNTRTATSGLVFDSVFSDNAWIF
ncbi:MAG: hypothetical protein WDA74_10020, partial [Spirochaetota bacterium]